METTDGGAHLWLSISQACPGVWAAGALCGAQAGYLDGVWPQISRHRYTLFCLPVLYVGCSSGQSMFDLFSIIHRFLWCPSSLISSICDFLTAEPWQMSTGKSCHHGLKGCCPELSFCFSVAGSCLYGRVGGRMECLKCWTWSPAELKYSWSWLYVEVLGEEYM